MNNPTRILKRATPALLDRALELPLVLLFVLGLPVEPLVPPVLEPFAFARKASKLLATVFDTGAFTAKTWEIHVRFANIDFIHG